LACSRGCRRGHWVRVMPHPCGRGLKDNYLRPEACQTFAKPRVTITPALMPLPSRPPFHPAVVAANVAQRSERQHSFLGRKIRLPPARSVIPPTWSCIAAGRAPHQRYRRHKPQAPHKCQARPVPQRHGRNDCSVMSRSTAPLDRRAKQPPAWPFPFPSLRAQIKPSAVRASLPCP
jgi:hypothetical protein